MNLSRRKFLTVTALLAGSAAASTVWASNMRTYSGPVSDHFDGLRFFDPHGAKPKSLIEVLRWQTDRNRLRAVWPEFVDYPYRDTPPKRVEQGARLSYVGHASWLIQTGGQNILLDPVWSERASPFSFVGPKRHSAPGIAFDDLPKIDTVLVTHGHYDHLDVATLARLARRDAPRVITPLGNDIAMKAYDKTIRVEAYDWGDRVDLGGMQVHLVPTRHWSARGLLDRNKALWASFVLESPAGKLYLVGDSSLGDGTHFKRVREKHGAPRLAILPIGAYAPRWFMSDQHMNPEEAVQALGLCGAEQALAHHFGTFQLTDEPIDEPEQGLLAALDAAVDRARAVSGPEAGAGV